MATIPEALALAVQQHQAGQRQAAEQIYRQILAVDPNHADALHLLGLIAFQSGQYEVAIDHIQRAIALRPIDAVFHSNLGAFFRAAGLLDESIAACRRALELNPNYPKAHLNLGAALQDLPKLDDAVVCFRRALQLKPDYAEALSNLGNVSKDLGKLDDAVRCFRQAIELKPELPAAHRNLLFTLAYCPNVDARDIYEAHARWSQQWAEPYAQDIAAHSNDPAPNRRLRIGYVSPDFCDHCQSFFTWPLFSAHDHQQFEIICYADVPSPDNLTARLRSCADHWTDIVGKSAEEIAQIVRQDQIDILVDLTMHMDRGHLPTFARKPAPVQVCWLAYPGTTGLTTIDYRLTDPYLDPPGLNDSYYSEQSIRLPDSFWCYDPLTDRPAVNALPALTNRYVTFGCLNNFCKVNAAVLELWAQVLRSVEQSRLLLLAPEGSARENALQILASAGISADRITFVARQPRPTYLELYHQIDTGLDTFPYNGHTTSLDSFWMGVPVITLVGQTVVGRAGLCQLQNLGLPELIAHTPDQFVEIAARLANDLPRLSHLRSTLRERIEKSPLMDAPRFARNIEAAYRAMWHTWCASSNSSSSG